jgi:hypothetical protein
MVATTLVDPLDVACHTLGMEGLENPDYRSLRVMRFKFDANDRLSEQVALQLNENQRHLVSIAFYGTRQLLISMEDYYAREGDLQRLGRRFRGHTEPIHLAPQIGSKAINEFTTRLQFRPLEQSAFDAMISLNPIRYEDQAAWEVPPLPNRMTNQQEAGHYLFVDVPTNALLSPSQRKMAAKTLSSEIASRRLWLHTSDLTSRDIHFKQKTSTYEPEAEPDDDQIEQVG